MQITLTPIAIITNKRETPRIWPKGRNKTARMVGGADERLLEVSTNLSQCCSRYGFQEDFAYLQVSKGG